MEDIKFIKKITDYILLKDRNIFGNCVYYYMANNNRAKLWCDTIGVIVEIININNGKIDEIHFPFANYFEPTQCSAGAPMWRQHIDNGYWHFEKQYKHVLPKDSDYVRLASAIYSYMEMFK
jgi:hypothetical protein